MQVRSSDSCIQKVLSVVLTSFLPGYDLRPAPVLCVKVQMHGPKALRIPTCLIVPKTHGLVRNLRHGRVLCISRWTCAGFVLSIGILGLQAPFSCGTGFCHSFFWGVFGNRGVILFWHVRCLQDTGTCGGGYLRWFLQAHPFPQLGVTKSQNIYIHIFICIIYIYISIHLQIYFCLCIFKYIFLLLMFLIYVFYIFALFFIQYLFILLLSLFMDSLVAVFLYPRSFPYFYFLIVYI